MLYQFPSLRMKKQIKCIGDAHGGMPFWYEVLREDTNPENLWRSLLYMSCFVFPGLDRFVRNKLFHPNSRVRAWACYVLGQMRDEISAEIIFTMKKDPSSRVRENARSALRKIIGENEAAPCSTNFTPVDAVILISDDSHGVQDLLAKWLQPIGSNIVFVSSEIETIEMATRLRPEVIITDNQKGKDNLSGLRTTLTLSVEPGLEETIFIMISADSLEGVFLWYGGDVFVPKHLINTPFFIDQISRYVS